MLHAAVSQISIVAMSCAYNPLPKLCQMICGGEGFISPHTLSFVSRYKNDTISSGERVMKNGSTIVELEMRKHENELCYLVWDAY